MSDPIYTEIIIDEARNAQNEGILENPDISQHDANPMCGDSITLQMKVNDDTISDIKWHGNGCTICKACTSVLTQLIKGKDLTYAKNLKKEEILSELGLEHLIRQSPVRSKCALLSLKTLKLGLYTYLAKKIENMEKYFKDICDSGLVRNIAQNFTTVWFKLFNSIEKIQCNSCNQETYLGKSEARICLNSECKAPI